MNAWPHPPPSLRSGKMSPYCAMRAIGRRAGWKTENHGIAFKMEDRFLTIQLPSGRKRSMQTLGLRPTASAESPSSTDKPEQTTGNWLWHETYAGKLVENITQAVARDILCASHGCRRCPSSTCMTKWGRSKRPKL